MNLAIPTNILTGRAVNRFWSGGTPFTHTYLNNRKQGTLYDAAGNALRDNYGVDGCTQTYDAARRRV